jgi:hypothetical protein
MLSLRTMFSAVVADGFTARIQLRMGDESLFWIRDGLDIRIGRGEIEQPHFTLIGASTEIAGVVYGGAPLETIGLEGDIGLARRFVTLFPMPRKAS